mmetsp:Transcript_5444/g.4900  ORF Transcript_5444/g.4900 Transcript_5444/m.4900 type:complete len:324 (+) Transcript_5444:27-998(+)
MIKSYLVRNIRNSNNCQRLYGSVNFKSFGNPTKSLNYNSNKSSASSPSSDEVVVSIKASQVTYEDIRTINGLSHVNKSLGIAGTTGVGSVQSIGSNVSNVKVGDNVLVVNNGTWSDSITIPHSSLYKINKLSDEESALLPSLLSAWAILTSYVPLKSGDSIIQIKTKGVIGLAINEVAKLLDIKVINLSLDELTSAGVEKKLPNQVLLGVTTIPGKPLNSLVKLLSDNGVVVVYQEPIVPVLSQDPVSLSVTNTIFHNKSISGFDFNSWVNNNSDKVSTGIDFIINGLNNKKITFKPKVYQLSQYLEAINEVEKSGILAVLKV